MNRKIGTIVWLENPKHGTIKAELRLASPNGESLLFKLEHPIALPLPTGGGMSIMDFAGVTHKKGKQYCDDIMGMRWKIYTKEPKVKLPSK